MGTQTLTRFDGENMSIVIMVMLCSSVLWVGFHPRKTAVMEERSLIPKVTLHGSIILSFSLASFPPPPNAKQWMAYRHMLYADDCFQK